MKTPQAETLIISFAINSLYMTFSSFVIYIYILPKSAFSHRVVDTLTK